MSINVKQRHFLQSPEWGSFQQALGKKIVTNQGEGWSYQALIGPNPGRIAKHLKCVFLPYGPTFSSPEALSVALKDVSELAKAEKADHIIVEPYSTAVNSDISGVMKGYTKLIHSRQPELTLVTDLSKPWEDVLQSMSKTNRYQWKYLSRDKISFEKTFNPENAADFVEMMRQTSLRTGARFPEGSYYKTMLEVLGPEHKAGIVYGYHDGTKMVGTLYVDDIEAGRRYYFYAGSYDKMRDLKVSLNASLVMFLQKDAIDSGLTSLDYFGVAPKDAPASHKWYGLSKFKRSLGGEDVDTLGTWEKPVNKLKFTAVKVIQKVISR